MFGLLLVCLTPLPLPKETEVTGILTAVVTNEEGVYVVIGDRRFLVLKETGHTCTTTDRADYFFSLKSTKTTTREFLLDLDYERLQYKVKLFFIAGKLDRIHFWIRLADTYTENNPDEWFPRDK